MRGPLSVRLAASTSPEPNSGCWLWCGGATAQGRYGVIRDGEKIIPAHRAAWLCANGPVPDGLHVCHRCDVTMCVNPDHLFLSDHAGNMADKARKLRAPMKLSPAQVIAIRNLALAGETHTSIAGQFGVSRPAISEICRGEKRRHV
jgi:hypothetical protein